MDRLQEIYPHEEGIRDVDERLIDSIRDLFAAGDHAALLNRLLDAERFPYKDSYIAFLRTDRSAIQRNPQAVQRISLRLQEMGIDKIIEGLRQAKEANTRRGPQFRRWTRTKFPWVHTNTFRTATQGVVMLDASERDAMRFCNDEMGVGIAKRPDLVAKSGKRYVIGEAKFLSDSGGNQGRAFDDGMTLAMNTQGAAFKIFVLDGIHWISPGSDQFNRIEHGTANIFSALLLEEYFERIAAT